MPLRPRRIDVAEHMDEPSADAAAVSGALDDLTRLNRLLGGADLTLRGVDASLRRRPVTDRPLRVLDVATGAADIPQAIIEHCDRIGQRVEVTGLDVKPLMLEEARRRTAGRVELVLGDALALSFDDGAFDIVTCSLMLHHFQPDEAIAVLQEMARVSAHGVLVNDLIRAWHPWIVAKLLAHTVTRNELTRFDGPVSVLRAYTPDELKLLFEAAGLTPRWRASLLGYRMALLGSRD